MGKKKKKKRNEPRPIGNDLLAQLMGAPDNVSEQDILLQDIRSISGRTNYGTWTKDSSSRAVAQRLAAIPLVERLERAMLRVELYNESLSDIAKDDMLGQNRLALMIKTQLDLISRYQKILNFVIGPARTGVYSDQPIGEFGSEARGITISVYDPEKPKNGNGHDTDDEFFTGVLQ